MEVTHPLDPLTPFEITAVSLAAKKYILETISEKVVIKFLTASILAPAKRDVLNYLGIPEAWDQIGKETRAERAGQFPMRRAEMDFVNLVSGDAYNVRAKLDAVNDSWSVHALTKLPVGVQPQISPQELIKADQVVRSDERIVKLAAAVGVKREELHADGWSIGYDARFPESQRIQQCLLFARYGKDDNLYAHPLDFSPVIDSNTFKVIHIDFAPHRISSDGALSAPSTAPPPLEDDALKASGRERIPPPKEAHNFLPDLLAQKDGFKPRKPLKPLHIVQPEGVSFSMRGHELEWDRWRMHVAFSHREGIAISTVTYDDAGELRPLFYRLSLCEMVVPYAVPEHPHPRKFAFDVGEYGMGTQANSLALGCDCLGKIHYLPGTYISQDGSPIHIKNAICIHEEDAGLLWKHTDFRPGGCMHSVRSRRLVISMICTLANYEYCFYYYFYLDGSIELEIRLTGIVSVYLLAQGEQPGGYGTKIAEGINAQFHQHIFSIRVDPMLDGLGNSVVETDVVPLGFPTGSKENYAGNAFTIQERTLKTPKEGARNYDAAKDRRWSIVNPSRTHAISKRSVGYALGMKGSTVPLLANEDSWIAWRAGFTKRTIWVVRDRESGDGEGEERMYPAGKYVPQTRATPEESVVRWAEEDKSIEQEDILVFATIGVNHIPRPEDWPVMPSDHLRMTLKPVHFFHVNPSLDVASGLDEESMPAFADGVNGVNGLACH